MIYKLRTERGTPNNTYSTYSTYNTYNLNSLHTIAMAPEGRESPPPERQTGSQLHNPVSSGTSTSKEQATKEWKENDDKKGTEV